MRTTFCHVKIVTPALPGRPSETFEWAGPDGPATLPGLESVEVTDSVDGFVNRFSLTISPASGRVGYSDSLAERIPAYSLVTIDMGKRGGPGGDDGDPTAIVGLTLPAEEAEAWTPQGRNASLRIAGRGIECVLADATVWFAPYLETHQLDPSSIDRELAAPYLEQLTGQLIWSHKIIGQEIDPRQALLAVLLYYLLNHTSATMSLLLPGVAIRDLLLPDGYTPATLDAAAQHFPPQPGTRYEIPATWTFIGDYLAVTKLLLPTGTLHPQPGPILNMLYSLTDTMFHELFVRYENAGGMRRARIMHRVKPFGGPSVAESLEVVDRALLGTRPKRSRFNANEPSLETVEVFHDELIGSQVKAGMADVRNVFFVTPGQSAMFQNSEFKALLAPEFAGHASDWGFIGRYGIRPLEHTTPHLAIGRNGATDEAQIVETARLLSTYLKAWYDPQPVMREGTLRVLGSARFRAGQRLILRGETSDGVPSGRPTWEYYVRAVSRQYDCATAAYVCTLQVSRGWMIAAGSGV